MTDAMNQSAADVDAKLLKKYQKLVGAILFCVTTVRPDAAYAAGMLARAMSKPTEVLYQHAIRLLQYLYTTRELGIYYSRNVDFKLSGMSDSDWQVRCSTSGYAFFLANAVISFLSKKQPVISMCSTQTEIYAASLAALEACFLTAFADIVAGKKVSPIRIGVDNKGAVDMSHNFKSNSNVRHFERRQLKVRELVERAIVDVYQIGTADNVSDIFTKALGRKLFEKHRKVLLNLPS